MDLTTLDIISAKRDKKHLTKDSIRQIILGYTNGDIPDYQMSAFLMACYVNGLSFDETKYMTNAMIESGETLDLDDISGIKVDKHSTGGVGDKTSLVLIPLLASFGLKVAKLSGRGLGFTGGTLDKLESIPGMTTDIPIDSFKKQIREIGACISGQSINLVPADKKIYALRDVTATVGSIPLIASSIMSKKLACKTDIISLDVKVGSGAFMKDVASAKKLTNLMVKLGKELGRKVTAMITDMNQPLGKAVGNSLEVIEAIETLKGKGPYFFRELCILLTKHTLDIAGIYVSLKDIESKLTSGEALNIFKLIIEKQNGNPDIINNYDILPKSTYKKEIKFRSSGYLNKIECDAIGKAAVILGAGRIKKDDLIDHSVGLIIDKKIGDKVVNNDIIATIYANDKNKMDYVEEIIYNAICVEKNPVKSPPLIYCTI
ncbi:MAG: thymidine phosphorylase [Armatimonadota bacterium]